MRIIPWLLTLMLMASPVALAEDDEEEKDDNDREELNDSDVDREEDDEKDDRDEDEAEREVDVEVSGSTAKIQLSREDAAGEDEIKMAFDTEEAKLEIKYKREADDAEQEQKLKATFHQLIEFVDANGNGAYDVGETIASSYVLGDEAEVETPSSGTATWQPLTVSDVTSNATPGKKISGRATFGNAGVGVFGLDFYVFGDFAEVENATLQPTETKIDIIIQHYPYTRNDTRLGVVLTLKAGQEFEREHEFIDDTEDGIAASGTTDGTGFSLVFTWQDSAIVDGVTTPVRSTVLRNETSSESEQDEDETSSEREEKALVVLSYARGEDILHDPTAGVSYQTLSAGSSLVPASGVMLVTVALVGAALLGMRRRG